MRAFFDRERPSVVVDAAAKVGGIVANNEQPVEFLLQNVTIQNNLIEAAANFGTRSCSFWGARVSTRKWLLCNRFRKRLPHGPLEVTNEAYAIAKIIGIKLCQAYAREYGKTFISAMPTNLYGPNDNFDLHSSHVLPRFDPLSTRGQRSVARISWSFGARDVLAKSSSMSMIWQTPACFLLERYDSRRLSTSAAAKMSPFASWPKWFVRWWGSTGSLVFDATKPDGTPRKLLDVSLLFGMGWRPKIGLRDGIRDAYQWFRSNK